MKFFILAIIAVHLANFGEAQVTIAPLIPEYCNCANLWIQKTVDKLGLSASVTNGKLAKKIMNNFLDAADPDDNVGCFAKYPDFKYMFSEIGMFDVDDVPSLCSSVDGSTGFMSILFISSIRTAMVASPKRS